MQNTFRINADLKKRTYTEEPLVTQNDRVTFIISVSDDGSPFPLQSVATATLAHKRLDCVIVVTQGTVTGTNTVEFTLGTEETKVPGRVEATVQLYDSEGRVSTISFTYQVLKDPTGNGYIPSEREQTLIETVLGDGPLVIQQAQDAANFANEQGQFAQEQANAANEAAQSATNAANEANAAAQSANTAAASANAAADNANTKATNAQTQADYAKAQGDYAKTQGNYAKAQGDYSKAQGDYAKSVADANKTHWLNPVVTFADIATTYPNPQHGDTVQTTSDGKIYRYENGQWNWTQAYTDTALADAQNKIGILNEQFNDIAKDISGISDFELPFPSDFPKDKLGFNLFYDAEGKIKHNFTYNETGKSIYWSEATGSDINDGLSPQTPVKTFKKALDLANTMTENDVVINLMDKIYTRNTCIYDAGNQPYTMQKNLIIKSMQDRSYIGTIEKIGTGGITFAKDGNAWKADRTKVVWVVDLKYTDEHGEPLVYKKATSLTECQNTQGSFYTDGTSVWIRRKNDEQIVAEEILVILDTASITIYTNGKTLFLKNITTCYNWNSNLQASFKVTGTPQSVFISQNCTFSFGGGNGLETVNVGKVLNFNSNAYLNGFDGFNYHETPMTTNPYTLVFEYYCKGYKNGQHPSRTQGINNGSTCHDGITVLRVGTVAFENDGPNIVDVNGCYSVNFNCLAYDSVRPFNDFRKAAFIFSNEGALKNGKAYLFNCSGGGNNTYAIGDQFNCDIYIRKFKGTNIPTSVLNQINFI